MQLPNLPYVFPAPTVSYLCVPSLLRIIIAQLEGSGRGKAGAYNAKQYDDLSTFLNDNPIRDGDAWLAQLMRKNSSVGECLSWPSTAVVQIIFVTGDSQSWGYMIRTLLTVTRIVNISVHSGKQWNCSQAQVM